MCSATKILAPASKHVTGELQDVYFAMTAEADKAGA